MRILSLFVTLVAASSFLQNVQQQTQQVKDTLRRQASAAHSYGSEKLEMVTEKAKKLTKYLKNKILGKKPSEEKEKDANDAEEFDVDSNMLKEFLEQLSKQFANLQANQQQNGEEHVHGEGCQEHEEESTEAKDKHNDEVL